MIEELLGVSVLILGIYFLIFIVVMRLIEGSKSNQYRKLMTNVYIVGKIKKYADEEKLDLSKELKEYFKIRRINKSYVQSLDKTIEVEIQQKIQEDREKLEEKKV